MSDWTEPDRCSLCGNTDRRELWFTIVHWRDAAPGMAYEHVPACRNREGCRARVIAAGDPWPLVESKEERRAS